MTHGNGGEKDRDVEVLEADEEATDPIQKSIGKFGKWQLLICLALSACKIPVAWHQLGIVFLAPPVNFTCVEANGEKGAGLTFWESAAHWMPPFLHPGRQSTSEIAADDSQCYLNGKECTKWQYDNSSFLSTIVTEWDLVCQKKELADVAQTIYMLGVLVGSVAFGQAADKWGRKIPLMITVILQIISGISTAYVGDYTVFLVLRFFDAAATGGEMVVSFVMCMELLSKKWRSVVSVLYHVPFFLGHCLLPVISFFIRDWRNYQLAISVPPVILLGYWWIIPESPRWLIAMGKKEEALKILQMGAKINKLDVPTMETIATSDVKEEPAVKATVIDLFRTPKLRVRSLCIFFIWITSGLGFFGLAQYMSKIGGIIFLNVAISGIMELPGSTLSIYFIEKFGRRLTVRVANLVAGISCLCILATKSDMESWVTVMLAALGVVGMSVCFPTIYLYSGELFPTVVRNAGVGTASMCARIGSMVAPFVTSLDDFLPPLIFGIFPIMGAGLTFFLPETLNTKLPNTIEEAENYDFDKEREKGIENKGFDSKDCLSST